MKLQLGQRTDPGPRDGPNQDAILGVIPSEQPDCALIVVSDGMGGAKAGDQASHQAIEVIKAHLIDNGVPGPDDMPWRINEAITNANTAIHDRAAKSPELEGMGCTVVLSMICGDRFWIASVGDSRAYLIRNGEGIQLTEDHTWVNARVKEGLITQRQADNEYHHLSHVLERALGAIPQVEVDVLGEATLQPGDTLLLCSDGLYGVMRDEEIVEVALMDDVQEAADTLINRALEAAHDNLSVIVLRAS